MKVVQLPVELMDKILTTLARCPYELVAPVLAVAQQQMKLVDTDPQPAPAPVKGKQPS